MESDGIMAQRRAVARGKRKKLFAASELTAADSLFFLRPDSHASSRRALWYSHRMSEIHSLPRWQKLRERIRRRDGVCVICASNGITTPGDDVDHIVPIRDGGAVWDERNLQFLCKEHHRKKTAAEDSYRKRNWLSVDADGNLIGNRV